MTKINKYHIKEAKKTVYMLTILIIFLVIVVFVTFINKKSNVSAPQTNAVKMDSVCSIPFIVEDQPTPTPSPVEKSLNVKCDSRPVNLVFVLDRSEKMLEPECLFIDGQKDCRLRLEWMKYAALELTQKMALSEAGTQGKIKVGAISYGGSADLSYTHIGLTDIKDGLPQVLSAIEEIDYIGPGTCIECAEKSIEDLLNSQVEENEDGKNIVIIISDGRGDTNFDGEKITESEAAQKAIAQAEVLKDKPFEAGIFVIAYNTEDTSYMADTVKGIASGSSCLVASDAGSWDDIFEVFKKTICPSYPDMRHFGPIVTPREC